MTKIIVNAKRTKGRPSKNPSLAKVLIPEPKPEAKPVGYKEIIVCWKDDKGVELRRMYSNFSHGEDFEKLAEAFKSKVGGKFIL